MKKEINPEIIITKTIKAKIFQSGIPIRLLMAAAEPVLVLDIKNKPKKDKHIVSIVIVPNIKRNCFLSDFTNWFPIIAICPLLNAGRKRVKGEKIAELINNLLFSIFIFCLVFCLFIFVFCFMLKNKLADPNNPVRRGSNGSFNSMLKVIKPSVPVNKKTNNARNFFSSKKNIFRETSISPIAMIVPDRF